MVWRNRRQNITWTNAELVHRRIYAHWGSWVKQIPTRKHSYKIIIPLYGDLYMVNGYLAYNRIWLCKKNFVYNSTTHFSCKYTYHVLSLGLSIFNLSTKYWNAKLNIVGLDKNRDIQSEYGRRCSATLSNVSQNMELCEIMGKVAGYLHHMDAL